jgi:hypothetical protein
MLEILILPIQIFAALIAADAVRSWNVRRKWNDFDYDEDNND